ncbi:MAG: zinc-ribbon domain-containing protein [Planctomycetes bacterium]|nr:zinc-ribbon domain-containing protein [Planctomycetota bacterium]
MIIFFGTRGISSRLEVGEFHCPRCGPGSPYEHKRVRRFFHLWYIPLVPVGARQEFVECGTCKGAFDPEVLTRRVPEAAPEFDYAYQRGVLRAMVAVLPAAGEEQEAERLAEVRDLYRTETGVELGLPEVRSVLRQTEGEGDAVVEELKDLGRRLDALRRTRIIQATRRVAQRKGAPSEEIAALLRRIEAALSNG